MMNFQFHNPTKILFGEGQIAKIAQEIPVNARVLITYGGGSIKKNGVYKQVIEALVHHTVFEFFGIEPNPTYETLINVIPLIRSEKIDYILAVGGGSVIDGSKFIAGAALYDGEPWELIRDDITITKAIPLAAILTLPATGSESNSGAMITRQSSQDKLFFGSPLVRPRFAVLDPKTTMSLPQEQISNGIVDAFVHVMEQYLTYPIQAEVQDRFSESLLQTLIQEGPKALTDPEDYTVRANIMWSATLALNGLIGLGVPQDWATHFIGHELTAKYNIAHGRTLAIILPTLLEYKKEQKQEKLIQYAERVWRIDNGTNEEKVMLAIEKTRTFFEQLGVPTRLKDYGVPKEDIDHLIEKLVEHNMVKLGEHQDITPEDARQILLNSY